MTRTESGSLGGQATEYYSKVCRACEKEKPVSEFHLEKNGLGGYKSKCKLCINAVNREWKEKNKEKVKATGKEWRIKNADKLRKRTREYQIANPEKHRADQTNYIHRKRAGGGGVTSQEWEALKKRYGYMCLRCERKDVKLTQDHITPIKLGGKHEIDNVQPLCRSCNTTKRTTIINYRIKYINL